MNRLTCLSYAIILFAVTTINASPARNQRFPTAEIEEKTIELANGAQLTYAEHGAKGGKTLILLHGFTDSWHSFDRVITQFPQDIHVFAISQRGHGNSFKPGGNLSLSDFAADVAHFVKKLQLGPSIIAGHCLGGLVTQQFALDYPELTQAIVIIDSEANLADNAGMPEFLAEVKKLTEPVPYAFAEEFQKSSVHKSIGEERMAFFISESMKVPAQVWVRVADTILNSDLTSSVHSIRVPALVLWGDQDSICPLEDQNVFVASLTDATFISYKGIGHAPHWEDGSAFVRDVTAFIRRIDDPSTRK